MQNLILQKKERRARYRLIMMKKIIKRYFRYVKYIIQWLFLEKFRGLDFTMRDTHLLAKSGGIAWIFKNR